MSSIAVRFAKLLRVSTPTAHSSSLVVGVQRTSRLWCSTDTSAGSDEERKTHDVEEEFDDIPGDKSDLAHGVAPEKGWRFRGVHKAILCGRVGQAPVQKILRNGRTLTIFTVGTGGMFDHRTLASKDLPKPVQWHRIVVHNEALGNIAVRQLVKNCSVYVEGDIETRVYNDSINGEVKNIPEICVRRDGRIRVIQSGEGLKNISFDDLREGLL